MSAIFKIYERKKDILGIGWPGYHGFADLPFWALVRRVALRRSSFHIQMWVEVRVCLHKPLHEFLRFKPSLKLNPRGRNEAAFRS